MIMNGAYVMKDEDIARLVAYDLNERRPEEDAWRRVAMGELDPDVLVAERRDMEPEDELEHKRELFTPSDADARARMREDLRARFYSETKDDSIAPEPSVVPLSEARNRRRSRSPVWGGVLAAAAAAVLVFAIGRPDSSTGLPTDSEPMGSYEIRLMDTWSGSMRSVSDGGPASSTCAATYHRDRSIAVRLHPQQATGDEVAVATLARSVTGESMWWPAAASERGPDGVLTIRRTIADLGLTPGTWTLTFFITRAGERLDLELLEELAPGAHPGVSVVETTVCIEG